MRETRARGRTESERADGEKERTERESGRRERERTGRLGEGERRGRADGARATCIKSTNELEYKCNASKHYCCIPRDDSERARGPGAACSTRPPVVPPIDHDFASGVRFGSLSGFWFENEKFQIKI